MSKRHVYKGINFRSLLEWDWARYLDWEQVEWSYEPKTFSNERGRYKPDFQVGNLPIYFEVKGNLLNLNRHIDACKYPLIFALGGPKEKQIILFLEGKPVERYTDWRTAFERARQLVKPPTRAIQPITQRMDTMSVNGTPKPAPPANAAEAETRFFAKYGGSAGTTWAAVQGFIGSNAPKPTTIEGWIAVAESVRDQIRIIETAADEESPLFPLKPNNDMARLVTAFERIATALEKLSERPAPAVPASAKPKLEATFGPDGIPICPKHNRRMRESDFGGWFCTAKDDEGKNGRCGFKVKE